MLKKLALLLTVCVTPLLNLSALPVIGLGEDVRLKTPSSGILQDTASAGIFKNQPATAYQPPAGVSGVLFDFDAARGISLNGSDVSRWEDSSGNLNHATQASAGNQPVYTESNQYMKGYPTVDFHKASTEWLGVLTSTSSVFSHINGLDVPMTIFAVIRKPEKLNADEVFLSMGNTATSTTYYSFGYVYQNSNTQRQRFRIQGSTNGAETTLTGGEDIWSYSPHIAMFSNSGEDSRYFIMGTSQNPYYDVTVNNNSSISYSTQGFVSTNRMTIGALGRNTVTLPLEGELARLVGYRDELSESERADVAAFLWDKYIAETIDVNDFVGIKHNWDASLSTQSVGAPVDTFVDQVGSKNFTTALSSRPIVALGPNDLKVLEFDGVNDFMTAGVAGDWNILHGTTAVSVFVVYRTVDEMHSSTGPILDTVNSSFTTRNGIGLYHYNLGGSSHTFTWLVGASSPVPVINQPTQDFRVVPKEWHIAAFNYENLIPSAEENYRLWFDNEPFISKDFIAANSTSAASFPLHLARLANTNSFARIQVAQILVFNRPVGWRHETGLINKALARKWGAGISASVGGNGLPNLLNDTLSHRGFPATVFDRNGSMHILYRRALDHGSSEGSAVDAVSTNGIDWPTGETVVASGEVASGISDIRIGSGYERITSGSNLGRLCWMTEISSANSSLVPGTVYAYYSDDNGTSFTRVHVNPDQAAFDLNGSASGMKWLQSGKMLATFAASQPGEGSGDQDIYITTSADCATWSTPQVLIDHDNVPYRITETSHVQYADGMILMLWRDDTNHVIYKATTTNEYTSFSTATAFNGWGWPNIVLDENERLYCFYRSEDLPGSDRAVYRYSDDRGITWADEAVMTNMGNQNLGGFQYPNMTYTDAKLDFDGNLWIAYSLQSVDSDVFAKKWRAYPVVTTATVSALTDRWWSTYGMSNTFSSGEDVGDTGKEWIDFSSNADEAIQVGASQRPSLTEKVYTDQSAITFDGVDESLEFTEVTMAAWTIFYVVNNNVVGPVLGDSPTAEGVFVDPSFAFTTVSASGGDFVWNYSALQPFDIVTINSEGQMWVNGTLTDTSDIPVSVALTIDRIGVSAGSFFFSGDIGDIVLAAEILDSDDMNSVGSYLSQRWDKTWTQIP